MRDDRGWWRNAIIALAATGLFTVGLAIVVYVGLARERIVPTATPTSRPPSRTPSPTATPVPVPTDTPPLLTTAVGIVRDYEPGALIIVLTPLEGTIEQVIVPEGLEVVWASGERASPREIAPGQTLFAEGLADAVGRLIAERIVISRPPEDTPTPTLVLTSTPRPSPTPSPSATPSESWQGEYYGNPKLEGAPLVVRRDSVIDFQWGEDAPAPEVPADNFSVRWRGRWTFQEGGYRFYAFTDDGVRVWIDGALVIDSWRNQSPTLSYGDLYVDAGVHDLQVEYFDGVHNAQTRVWWDFRGAYPSWRGEFFDNLELEGDPILVRNDADVAFDWGHGAPDEKVPADAFSARWTRTIVFEAGAYRFFADVDDGIRVWVDGLIIIDAWQDTQALTHTGHIWLEGDAHELRVEYYEREGDARVRLWWERIEVFENWTGAYYANPDLEGRPVFVRDDETIDYDWGDGAPALGLPIDGYSVRWSRSIETDEGTYLIWALADDGVRVLVDSKVVIDEWHESPAERHEIEVALAKGEHIITVEYYERGDQAVVRMGWEVLEAPTPVMTETPASTHTPVAPTWTAISPTSTATPTETTLPSTSTPTVTQTGQPPTATNTATVVPTASATATLTSTLVPTEEPTVTSTASATPSPSPTPEPTPIPATSTPTLIVTRRPVPTRLPVPMLTGTPTHGAYPRS